MPKGWQKTTTTKNKGRKRTGEYEEQLNSLFGSAQSRGAEGRPHDGFSSSQGAEGQRLGKNEVKTPQNASKDRLEEPPTHVGMHHPHSPSFPISFSHPASELEVSQSL